MENKKVSGNKISALIAFNIMGASIVISSGKKAEQDSWIATSLATGAALLLAWLYSAILGLYPGKGMFEIFQNVFGSVGGKIVCGLYALYAVLLGAKTFYIFNEFIQIVNLDKTPVMAIMLLSVLTIAWQARCGLRNMGNCAKVLLPFILIFVVVTCVLGIRFMNPAHICPVLGSGPKKLADGTVVALSISFGDIVLCMSFFGETETKKKPFRIMANGILIGGSFFTVTMLRNLLILGAPTNDMFIFSSYDAVGVISVGSFVTRISVLVGINLVLAGVLKVSTLVYAAATGTSSILGLKNRLAPTMPLCLLMGTLSCMLFQDVLAAIEFNRYMPLLSMPVQIAIPLLTLIVGKARAASRAAGGKAGSGHSAKDCTEPG